ncbi:MAG: sulfotransferase domain-containing protein [Hyphomonadaceae bacterium]|nr:sulfotransferase domain-containing protein [Hyphomonadaceae bacterium]
MLGKTAPPEYGHLFFVKTHEKLPVSWISPKYRYIANFRDPRDRLCNIYHWHLSYRGQASPSSRLRGWQEAEAERLQKMGIDKWIIEKAKTASMKRRRKRRRLFDRYDGRTYDYPLRVAKEIPGQCLVVTYARLCLDFDGFVHRLSQFTGVHVTKRMWGQLRRERPENLEKNPKWAGNKRGGCDAMPGRYKHELQPDTVKIISKQLKPYLRRMAKYDPDYAHLYLEGLPGQISGRATNTARHHRMRRRLAKQKRLQRLSEPGQTPG